MKKQMYQDFKFSVKEKAEDPKDSVIEKRGHVLTFTIRDVENHLVDLEKGLREFSAQKGVEEAKIVNFEEHHPFLKDMSEQDIHTAYMYQIAKNNIKELAPKTEAIEKQIADYKCELEEVNKQING